MALNAFASKTFHANTFETVFGSTLLSVILLSGVSVANSISILNSVFNINALGIVNTIGLLNSYGVYTSPGVNGVESAPSSINSFKTSYSGQLLGNNVFELLSSYGVSVGYSVNGVESTPSNINSFQTLSSGQLLGVENLFTSSNLSSWYVNSDSLNSLVDVLRNPTTYTALPNYVDNLVTLRRVAGTSVILQSTANNTKNNMITITPSTSTANSSTSSGVGKLSNSGKNTVTLK